MKIKFVKIAMSLAMFLFAIMAVPNIVDAAPLCQIKQVDATDYSVRVQYYANGYVGTGSKYEVQVSSDGGVTWGTKASSTTLTDMTIVNLLEGRTYKVRARLISPLASDWAVTDVATAPASTAATLNVIQTAATANSYTIKWNAVYGASGYNIKDSSTDAIIASVTGTTYTQKGLPIGLKKTIKVEPVRSTATFNAAGYAQSVVVVTTPSAPSKSALRITSVLTSTAKVMFAGQCDPAICSGFEVVGYNAKSGKKVFTTSGGATFSTTSYVSVRKGATYKYKMRYYIISGTQKFYSAYSPAKYFAFTTMDRKSKYKFGSKTLTTTRFTWNKVPFATKYVVYMSTKQNSGFKKVATVGKKKTSCVVNKFKGKRLSRSKAYYVKLVVKLKVKGKKVKNDLTYKGKMYNF